MNTRSKTETEVFMIEVLISALDARESAKLSGSTMLVYLADMLVQITREELEAMKPAKALAKTRR